MIIEEAVNKLKDLQNAEDPAQNHRDADNVLCEVLRFLGYHDLVTEWEKIYKWYE